MRSDLFCGQTDFGHDEIRLVSIDFATALGAGESLSAVAAELVKVTDESVVALADAATIDGTKAVQKVKSLTVGTDYYLRLTVTIAPGSYKETREVKICCAI